jgi:hypothetical protein
MRALKILRRVRGQICGVPRLIWLARATIRVPAAATPLPSTAFSIAHIILGNVSASCVVQNVLAAVIRPSHPRSPPEGTLLSLIHKDNAEAREGSRRHYLYLDTGSQD